MPGMVFTPSLFNVLCNLLSSVVVVLCTAFFFLKKAKTHSLFQKNIQFLLSRSQAPVSSQLKTNPSRLARENFPTQAHEFWTKQQLGYNLLASKQAKLHKKLQNLNSLHEAENRNSVHSTRKENWQRLAFSVPSDASLSASADGTGHLHELFLVHVGGDGVPPLTRTLRYSGNPKNHRGSFAVAAAPTRDSSSPPETRPPPPYQKFVEIWQIEVRI